MSDQRFRCENSKSNYKWFGGPTSGWWVIVPILIVLFTAAAFGLVFGIAPSVVDFSNSFVIAILCLTIVAAILSAILIFYVWVYRFWGKTPCDMREEKDACRFVPRERRTTVTTRQEIRENPPTITENPDTVTQNPPTITRNPPTITRNPPTVTQNPPTVTDVTTTRTTRAEDDDDS